MVFVKIQEKPNFQAVNFLEKVKDMRTYLINNPSFSSGYMAAIVPLERTGFLFANVHVSWTLP